MGEADNLDRMLAAVEDCFDSVGKTLSRAVGVRHHIDLKVFEQASPLFLEAPGPRDAHGVEAHLVGRQHIHDPFTNIDRTARLQDAEDPNP